ncbi:MAG: hypothetical protein P1V35_16875, partial [Planctomycetota bacterium]|nr:hypothetical protein [Planctomycetota bacterium]
GTPAHPALVVLRPGCNPSTGSLIETAEDGSFVAPGLVLGEHGFRVYQGTAVTELPSISVASGDRLQMQDRWLPTHEAISVTVVNAEGNPIEDAKVSVADANGVRVPHWDAARTDALGQATAQAPVGEGRSIHVLAVGYRLAEPMALPPGTTQRIITMQRQGTRSFRPIDAMTGEPLTSFQVKVERRSPAGDWYLTSPPWATSATQPGPATVSFEAGDRFGIYSKGYLEVVRVMEHSEPGILDVPLRPSPRIEGRVTLDGKPAPGVVLELSAGSVDPEFHRVPESDRGPHFLPQKSCIAWARTDERGRFSVDTFELQQDQYALHASLGSTRAGLAWIRLDEGSQQTVQVGDLELVETGSIRGQVLVPPGFLVSGLGLSVDAIDGPLGINVDPMGHFELDGVLPGRHALVVEPVGEIRAGNTKNFVHVNAGQTAEIVLDLSGLGVAFRPLELTLDGSPMVFHDTFVIPTGLVTEGEVPSEPLLHKHYFGSTDADGMVNGSAPCSGPAELWVLNPRTRRFMRHPSARIELDCTPTARMRFEFTAI